MRSKIIIVNAGIVLVMTVLSFGLIGSELRGVLSDPASRRAEVEHAIRAASAQLELDRLLLERWLAEQAARPEVRAVFASGTERARSESATAQADKIREIATANPSFSRTPPGLVLFVDAQGVAVGRNGSNLMRGDRMADIYPSLSEALRTGHTSSDLWLNRDRQEQLLASYAPVHDDEGKIVGVLVVGTPLNDERLGRTADSTSGRALVLGLKGAASGVEIIAKSEQATPEILSLVSAPATLEAASSALATGNVTYAGGGASSFVVAAGPLHGYPGGKPSATLMAVAPASLGALSTLLLWPLAAVAALGLLLVAAAGIILGNYVSQPISELEEGLLQIINGRTDVRFNIEHEDLGGLISRLNTLLNALMGVPETDEEGRTSSAPGKPYQE